MITTQIIENTKAFQELSPVTQLIYRKKEMMNKVKQEFQVAKNVGIEAYKGVYHPRPYVLKVIKELLENGW